MASVYKSLSKATDSKEEHLANGVKKNKQRVLILSSRGITYRFAPLLGKRFWLLIKTVLLI
jgi:ribosome biogenesis protein BRX1